MIVHFVDYQSWITQVLCLHGKGYKGIIVVIWSFDLVDRFSGNNQKQLILCYKLVG